MVLQSDIAEGSYFNIHMHISFGKWVRVCDGLGAILLGSVSCIGTSFPLLTSGQGEETPRMRSLDAPSNAPGANVHNSVRAGREDRWICKARWQPILAQHV